MFKTTKYPDEINCDYMIRTDKLDILKKRNITK